jgi:hypothetical protein
VLFSWQAALNMGGEPIKGQHWLIVELPRPALITRVLIDWETAYSTNWAIQGNKNPTECSASAPTSTSTSRLQSSRDAVGPLSSVDGCMNPQSGWDTLIDSRKERVMQRKTDKHVVQVATVDKKGKDVAVNSNSTSNVVDMADGFQILAKGPYKLVKLLIQAPSTNWGSSVWRFQVWGSFVDGE